MADDRADRIERMGLDSLVRDIPRELVDGVLDTQRQSDLFSRFSLVDWDATRQLPVLRHYIAVTSFEVAPDDIELRERVASAMLGLYGLLDEAVITSGLEASLVDQQPA